MAATSLAGSYLSETVMWIEILLLSHKRKVVFVSVDVAHRCRVVLGESRYIKVDIPTAEEVRSNENFA